MTRGGRVAVAVATTVAFAAGYIAPTRLATHVPALIFGCPASNADEGAAGDISGIAARAPLIETAALRRNGGTADPAAAPQVVGIIAVGLPGLDPGATGTLLADARRRCRDVSSAWAIVSFRRSGSADACCLDTIFVALANTHWFVF